MRSDCEMFVRNSRVGGVILRRIGVVASVVVLACVSVHAQDAPITDCDKHAASDLDFQRVSDPILFKDINPALAIPACMAAASQWPSSSRLTYQLGRSLLADKKWFQGIQNIRQAAEEGYAAAQLALGGQYEVGAFGMVMDRKEAALWFEKAASQGNPKAQFKLGKMFSEARENTQAFAWYCRAAVQGDADAQTNLGIAYLRGTAWFGAPGDPARAVEWFSKAAEQGDKLAKQNLSILMQQHGGRQSALVKGIDKCREALDCIKSGRTCR